MNIDKSITNGCDEMSRVYSDMFSYLQEVIQDDAKLKELNSLDYSALGMYIGKFVEQEINSSVVQIMRAFCGIEMPRYYCKRYPRFVPPVVTDRQPISLNSRKDIDDKFSLRTISLGDAYKALEVLKEEDKSGFFAKYSWLNNIEFLDAWHELSNYRNRMAHIGEIIDADILRKNYEVFQLFLKFMPEISKAKIELAPKESVSVMDLNKYKLTQDMMILADKFFPHEITYDDKAYYKKAYYDKAYYDKAKKFKVRKGKTGLKDSEGNILVPANYDNFGFLPRLYVDYKRRSVIAIRDSRYVLVALDGSGKELTKDTYDDIRLADNRKKNSPYIYRKNGRRLWGIMDELGNEICENIIDNYICSENSLLYESNELRGYWHFAEPTSSFIPPIYDDIDIMDDPKKTLVFTLNGMSGYVRHDGTFLSREEIKRKEEMGEVVIKDFICEFYED